MDDGYDPDEQAGGEGGGGGPTIGERLAVIETLLRSAATREDLSKLEIRMLKWGVGIVFGSVALALAIAKFFE